MKTVFNKIFIFASLFTSIIILPNTALATFSIIACEAHTKSCAAAIATNNLAVGASVVHVEAGVGAITSQFETNPSHGPDGLKMLAQREKTESVLSNLLDNDQFDGTDAQHRQLAIVNINGDTVIHTGKHAKESQWAGALKGKYYSIQGNGLKDKSVLTAMQKTFLNTKGPIGDRVMQSLLAGQRDGGQATGSMSSAIIVKTIEGFPHDIDLRVDFAKKPVEDLHQLFNLHYARQAIITAERYARQGKTEQVWLSVAEALNRGASWDRIWRRAARLAIHLNEKEKALDYLAVFMALNPEWAKIEITQNIYFPLRENPLFISWSNSQ